MVSNQYLFSIGEVAARASYFVNFNQREKAKNPKNYCESTPTKLRLWDKKSDPGQTCKFFEVASTSRILILYSNYTGTGNLVRNWYFASVRKDYLIAREEKEEKVLRT